MKNPKLIKTIRAEVTQEHFNAWGRRVKESGLNNQKVMALVVDHLHLIPGLEPLGSTTAPATALGTTLIVQLEPDRRVHITTRQAQQKRFKENLLSKAPECRLDIDESIKKRDLLYHSSHEAVVQVYLANCPKGSANESQDCDKTADKSGRGVYDNTKKKRVIRSAESILTSHVGPMTIDELYPLVKELEPNGFSPNDFSPKQTLRKRVMESSLLSLGEDRETVSLTRVEPPKVEELVEPPKVEELVEPPKIEDDPTLRMFRRTYGG